MFSLFKKYFLILTLNAKGIKYIIFLGIKMPNTKVYKNESVVVRSRFEGVSDQIIQRLNIFLWLSPSKFDLYEQRLEIV